ncbi:MAG: P-II family nitrogen regulator [Pseudolabrys sp.]|nr:P-II family nitrogen regulator [Pseudolabrys sp.]MDP2297056.1 P-II family nitrogen regulator [Pseudolabrys sp.]
MQFKLLLAMTEDSRVDAVLQAAREAGATGATVITSARGEGLVPQKTFLGLDLTGQCDVILLVVEDHLSRGILTAVARAGEFETRPGSGIAFQLAIEDAAGMGSQIRALSGREQKS